MKNVENIRGFGVSDRVRIGIQFRAKEKEDSSSFWIAVMGYEQQVGNCSRSGCMDLDVNDRWLQVGFYPTNFRAQRVWQGLQVAQN